MSKRITVPEIAEQLGIGRDTVYELLKRGEIPAIRLNAHAPYIIPRHAFEEWARTFGTASRPTLQ